MPIDLSEYKTVKLKSLSVSGFKSLRKVENLEFGSLNVVIGANGSGKSNLLDFFTLLGYVAVRDLQYYVLSQGGASVLLHQEAEQFRDINAKLTFCIDEKINEYSVKLSHIMGDTLTITDESISSVPLKTMSVPDDADVLKITYFIANALTGMRKYHFHNITAEAEIKHNSSLMDLARLRNSGENLSATLYKMKCEEESYYNKILDNIQIIAPFIENFIFELIERDRKYVRLRWQTKGKQHTFGLNQLSDSTLRFIALATLLLQPEGWQPDIILIDEPELGLHPEALALLANLLQQVAVDKQIIITTQSPTLLDFFESSQVIIAKRVDGATEFSRVDENAIAPWLEKYSLGELWRKNYIEGDVKNE